MAGQIRFILSLALLLITCSCANPFSQFSNSSTDKAIYEEALKASNASQWEVALIKFESLSANFLNAREVRFNYAKALAGRCGFDFVRFIDAVSRANFSGPATLFEVLLSMWGNRLIIPNFCTLAELQVKTIWGQLPEISSRTNSERFFIVFLSLAKMGMYLRVKADVDGLGGLGNGFSDVGVNACQVANPASQLLRFSNDEIKEVVTGLALFFLNITAIVAAISNISDLSGALNLICGSGPGQLNASFCSKVNAADVTPAEVTDFRKILQSTELGIVKSCTVLACCPP